MVCLQNGRCGVGHESAPMKEKMLARTTTELLNTILFNVLLQLHRQLILAHILWIPLMGSGLRSSRCLRNGYWAQGVDLPSAGTPGLITNSTEVFHQTLTKAAGEGREWESSDTTCQHGEVTCAFSSPARELRLAKYKSTSGGKCEHGQCLMLSPLIGLFKSNGFYFQTLAHLCHSKCPFSVGEQIPFWVNSITSQEGLTIKVQSRV